MQWMVAEPGVRGPNPTWSATYRYNESALAVMTGCIVVSLSEPLVFCPPHDVRRAIIVKVQIKRIISNLELATKLHFFYKKNKQFTENHEIAGLSRSGLSPVAD